MIDRRMVDIKETSAEAPVLATAALVSPWSLELCIIQAGQSDGLSLPTMGLTGLQLEPLNTGLGGVKTFEFPLECLSSLEEF